VRRSHGSGAFFSVHPANRGRIAPPAQTHYLRVTRNGCAQMEPYPLAAGLQKQTMTLAEIRDDFAFLDDWEDRYRYVIELGKALPEMEPALKTEANKVRGCASQVWLATRAENGRLHIIGDSDALIVRGLVAILLAIYQNQTPDHILSTDAREIFAELGLKEHLTPQRSNGFSSMVERIRADARLAAQV